MRSEPLLATPPPSVGSIGELYAIAFTQAQQATQRYGKLAAKGDETYETVRYVFEVLSEREQERVDSIGETCIAAIGRVPDQADLQRTPIDLVPAEELSGVQDSLLSTAYGAWALAIRHRERAFIFWTYIAALAESPAIREAAEDMAREALRDGNLMRGERRLAWRAERNKVLTGDSLVSEISSAALIESLLLKDIFRWSQEVPAAQRGNLLSLIGTDAPASAPAQEESRAPRVEKLEELKRRALRRAEQLSSIYLDEADRAIDQSRLELAQDLAARSIARLADLRAIAAHG